MSEPRTCDVLARRLFSASGTNGEDLARAAREEAGHLGGCRDCREELARRDPAALFALLALETKDEAFFTGFETRVMAGIREAAREERGGWLGAVLRPQFLALSAGVATIAVALALWMGSPPPPPRIAVGPEPQVPERHAPPPAPSPEAHLTLLERDAAEPSPVESVASATARVIAIKIAGPQQESSDLVLIVDPEMPL